jgi:hypothetical protein
MNFKPIHQITSFWRLQLSHCPWQQYWNIEPKSLWATEVNKLSFLRSQSSLSSIAHAQVRWFQSIKHTVHLSNDVKPNSTMIAPAEAESKTINGQPGSPIVDLSTFNSRNSLTEIFILCYALSSAQIGIIKPVHGIIVYVRASYLSHLFTFCHVAFNASFSSNSWITFWIFTFIILQHHQTYLNQ